MTQEDKKYFDARNDMIKAFKSVGELESRQREQLLKELVGIDAVTTIYKIMYQYWGR